MSKFKVGDEVLIQGLTKSMSDAPDRLNGKTAIITCVRGGGSLYMYKAKSNDSVDWEFKESQLALIASYQKSNRNKLREHIKSLGFSAIDLSVAAGFNKAYFGSETGESRFNSRGDISDDRLLELKHNAFSAMMKLKIEKSGYRNGGYVERKITPSDFCLHGSQSKIHLAKQNSKIPKILKRVEKPKSKWVVSNKVFSTFVFFFVLLISLAVTGIVKQFF